MIRNFIIFGYTIIFYKKLTIITYENTKYHTIVIITV